MEMQINESFFERDNVFTLCGMEIHFSRALQRKMKDQMALDLAEAALVFDENLGVCYEGYTYEMALVFLTMRYYTDFDLTDYQDSESWYKLYDLLESHGILNKLYDSLAEDIDKVLKLYEKVRDAAKMSFEKEHSLDHLAAKSFSSILSLGDVPKMLAEAGGINNTMLDMMSAFQKLQGPKEQRENGILSFRKKMLN